MKTIIQIILLAAFTFFAVMPFGRSQAQTKPSPKPPNVVITTMPPTSEYVEGLDGSQDKSVAVTKPVEVQFSASDAIKIAKFRAIAQEANNNIVAILKSYGATDGGEFIEDADHNWIGIRKTEVKAEAKKP